MSDCPVRWIGICKFRPRYDTGAPDFSHAANLKSVTGEGLDAFRPVTYVRDVCERCGATIERLPK